MRRLLLIALLISGIKLCAQDFDNLMVKKQLDCSDISYNSALLFERYFNENKMDSAKSLLHYWQGKCGLRVPVQRARILLAIKENNFQDSILTKGVLSYIFNYQNRMGMVKNSDYHSYDDYKPYYGYIPVGQEFDNFTRKSFGELKSSFDDDKMEYLLCEFYSNNADTIFSRIQTEQYDSSLLAKEYKVTADRYLNMAEFHVSWITGVWIPTGDLKRLGVHPELGFQVGVKHKKMNYDLIMAFRFLKAANDYMAQRPELNSSELTDKFFGGHIGIDVGRDIYAKNAHEVQLTGGIAYDGFDALKEDKELDLKSATASSYNLSLGVGYRYYISNVTYLGLRVKYNVVDYTLSDVVDFTGNPISIQFIVGGVNNLFRNNGLNALKYKQRR